jgi:hypothetical protein
MKNNKEDDLVKPISQSGFPDRQQSQRTPESPRQTSPADLARSRDIFTCLFASAPKAWASIEPTVLGEESPGALARKRDIFTGLMSGVSKAWASIEPTVLQTRVGHRSDNQSPRRPAAQPILRIKKGLPGLRVKNDEASGTLHPSNNPTGSSRSGLCHTFPAKSGLS